MLDLNYVRENLEDVRAALGKRGMPATALDDFAQADAERRRVIAESDQLNAERNAANAFWSKCEQTAMWPMPQ